MTSSTVARALGEVPLLRGLPAHELERLAAEVRTVPLAAGEWLFRRGDPAHSMFVIRFGRLEVVVDGPSPVVARVLTRGALVGELGLLSGGGRSASVFARRNSELIELQREQFDRLIRTVPAFAVEVTHRIGRQLAGTRAPAPPAPLPRSLGVVALDQGACAAEVAELLAAALREHGSVAHLHRQDAPDPDARLALVDRAAREHDRVLLDGGDATEDREWAEFCRDEADLVIAVSSGAPDAAWLARPAALKGCELLVIGRAFADAAVDVLAPREVHAIARGEQLAAAVQALARRLTGRAVGLVLSGGGARAFAHIGVYDELHAAGVRIDRVAGASMGAIVAAHIAMLGDPQKTYDVFYELFVRRHPTNDYTLPMFSLIRGRKTRRMIEEAFGEAFIEALPRRFYCVSCDLLAREVVLHRTGRVADALFASVAIPGIFPPVRDASDRLLVDGGVLDNLPLEPMAKAGEGPVIAVDVGQAGETATVARRAPRLGRLGRAVAGGDVALPRIGETLMRTLTLGSADTAAAALRHADLVITPRVEGVGMLGWKELDRAREIGRRAAREALAGYDGDVAELR